MPLRDHFRPPLDNRHSWEGFHGGWPAMIVRALSRTLPRCYAAEPLVRSGPFVEPDVVLDETERDHRDATVTAWVPPQPSSSVATELFDQDEYEVRVYDTRQRRRLVAAIEIVSPSNKDRPEHRRLFVARCVALLRQRVSVTVIDPVTTHNFNLYGELLDMIGLTDPSLRPVPPSLYATACRVAENKDGWRLECWAYPLTLGQPLPTLPLWLADNLAVPLELEECYEDTCSALRIV
jgi:hypothetical protein